MKPILRIGAISLMAAIACVAIMEARAGAQSYTTAPSPIVSGAEGHAGTWDFLIPFTYSPSTSWNGPGGSSVHLDAGWGFGFGAGYNFTDQFQLNGLFTWSSRDYTATIVNTDNSIRQYSNTLDDSTITLNAVYYFLHGNIRPFLAAGVGVAFLDTNIRIAPGSTVCWWDPWFGYVCSNSAPTKTESDLTYSVGAGLRFDITPQFSLQPSYNKAWVEIDRATSTPDFDVWRLDVIYRMP